MASPDILDFTALLRPISEDRPAGESLRYEGVYDAIQEARREEDALPMGEWQREVKTADWRAVIELGTEAIAARSKDLQIGVWVVEALIKRHGFAGLRDGLRLLKELQQAYWEGLFPEMEDGDLEFRGGPLNWLNEKLPSTVRLVALTEGEPQYSWNHWDESRKVDNLGRQNPEAMQAAIDEGKITGEQFDHAVDGASREFYETLIGDLAGARDQLSALEKTIDEKFGRDAPSLIKMRGALEDCFEVVSGIVKKKRAQDPSYRPEKSGPSAGAGSDQDGQPLESGLAAAAPSANWAGEPRSREEAFQRLAVIAAYLRRVEPQHPVTYLIERAVKWTRMPLDEWLGEVINNPDVLNSLRETLGIRPRDTA